MGGPAVDAADAVEAAQEAGPALVEAGALLAGRVARVR
jgi:hypothetical protein